MQNTMKFTELYLDAYSTPDHGYPDYRYLLNTTVQKKPFPRIEFGMRIEKGRYYSYEGTDFQALRSFVVDDNTHPKKFRRWPHVVLEE